MGVWDSALSARSGRGDTGVRKDGMDVYDVEIFDVALEPGRKRPGIFQRLAPLPSEEDGWDVLVKNLFAHGYRQSLIAVSVRCGDQDFDSLSL
jgi:hypothetical protein